jgi:hypothetical protein
METKASLVWSEGGVELDTVSTVDLGLELVVLPNYSELNDTLWDGNDLEGGLVFGMLFEESRVFEGGSQL